MSIVERFVFGCGKSRFSISARKRLAKFSRLLSRFQGVDYRVEPLERRMLLSNYSILATFNGTNGANPYTKTTADNSGNLYGTTFAGGANGDGDIWELAAGSTTITVLHSFAGADGANPQSGAKLVNGNLFGTTFNGGACGLGSIYEYNIASSTFTSIYSFNPTVDGLSANPYSGITFDASGNIWGTTKNGGVDGHGSIYELTTNGSGGYATQDTVFYSFTGGTDGKNPYAGFLSANGVFYGMTRQGGLQSGGASTGNGTIYEYTPGATSITTLYTFTGEPDGREANASLIMDTNGDLIGLTQEGGTANKGLLFELAKSGSGFATSITSLASFTGTANGQYPWGSPIIDSKGDIFGTTEVGGSNALGEVWELPAGSTTLSILHTFTGNPDGANPFAGVRMDSQGDLFGTTEAGGNSAGDGTIFEISSTTQLVFGTQPASTTAGTLPTFTVDVEDQYGNIITTDNSTVTLSVHSGPGLLTGTVSVAAVNGVATFSSAALDTTGTYTINAVDGSDTSVTSNSVTITPAAASQVVFNQQPSTVTAGVAISPAMTVDVEDRFGNIVTTDSSNVTLSVHTGPGTLSGTVTAAASAGVATFSNVLIDTAGTYSLTASDGILTPGNSSTFTVNPAAATKLAYSVQPTDVATGAIISPAIVVDVEDTFGNIVTGNSSNVTLSVQTGPGSLSGTTTVAANHGVATFSNIVVSSGGTYTLKAADGSLTTAISSSFTASNGAASKLEIAVQPSDATAGAPNSPSIVVDVEDPSGSIVGSNTSTVTLAVHTGPGTLSGTVSVAAVNGVATFSNAILDTAGTYTLTASDGSLVTATTSSFTVVPAASSQLIFSAQPTNTVINTPIDPPVVLEVEDAFGNIVTTDTSDVTLAVASGPGNIGGTTTVAAVAGVATFDNVTLDQTGLYTLGASDGSLTGAVSNGFHVTLTAPTQVVFATQPGNTTAGDTFSPVMVNVEDAFGNIADADDSNVTLSIATGTGTLSGTLTIQAVNGVATFSDLSMTTAGTYTIEATDGDLTAAVSNSFTISPAAPTQIAFAVQPSDVSTGLIMSPAVVVAVEDQFGNRVTSDNSQITLSLASGPGQLSGTLTQNTQSGAATFNDLSLNEVGAYKLQATDGSFPAAVSNTFNDSPPVRLLVVVRQTTTAEQFGNVFANVKLAIEDVSGNLITSDTSTVTATLASAPSGAALSGTTTAQFSDGFAVFTRLSVNRAGNYTITFDNGEAATDVPFTDPIPVVRIPIKFRWWFGSVAVAPPVPIPDPFRLAASGSGSSSDSEGSGGSSSAPAVGSAIPPIAETPPSSTLDSNNSDNSDNSDDNQVSWLQ
jgi:uncharacterized repeat protein (TIGR03803 family)